MENEEKLYKGAITGSVIAAGFKCSMASQFRFGFLALAVINIKLKFQGV